jgi:hypothetical protein
LILTINPFKLIIFTYKLTVSTGASQVLLTICSAAHQAQSQSAKFVKVGLFDGGIQAPHLCHWHHAQLLADAGLQ